MAKNGEWLFIRITLEWIFVIGKTACRRSNISLSSTSTLKNVKSELVIVKATNSFLMTHACLVHICTFYNTFSFCYDAQKNVVVVAAACQQTRTFIFFTITDTLE